MELPDSCEGQQLNGARPCFVVNNRLGLTPVSAEIFGIVLLAADYRTKPTSAWNREVR